MSIQHYVAANANPVRPDEATHYRHLVTYADHLEALRDCEGRVYQDYIAGRQNDRVLGYLRGLDAAREAVADINGKWVFGPRIYKHKALAAIDALREER